MRNVEIKGGGEHGIYIEVGDVMNDYDGNNGSAQMKLSEAEAALLMEKLRNFLITKER